MTGVGVILPQGQAKLADHCRRAALQQRPYHRVSVGIVVSHDLLKCIGEQITDRQPLAYMQVSQ